MDRGDKSRSEGVSGIPDALEGSLPSCCFFVRASIHGVRTLFSVKARRTPSVERVAEVANWRRAGAHPEIDWLGFARAKNRSLGVRVAIVSMRVSPKCEAKFCNSRGEYLLPQVW